MHIIKTTGFSLLTTAVLLTAGPASAGTVPIPPTPALPTLSEWGLAGIAALLAVAAGRALRNRGR
ncbi:MAG: IPTL-CTERM sorting domain-containing protein [Porticoccaceae bacterium]